MEINLEQIDDDKSVPKFQDIDVLPGENDFIKELGEDHVGIYVQGDDTLVVCFENLDKVEESNMNRAPWGYSFISGLGHSFLGLMAAKWSWYRDNAVLDFFDELKEQVFFDQFSKVVFYGASMGGYAAAAFSSVAPGSTVIIVSPQATLERRTASWETRYRKAWIRDFTGRYGYAPDQVKSAKKVHLFFDPDNREDAMRAALFRGENIYKFRCLFLGHRMASLMQRMGILKSTVLSCINGDITSNSFYSDLRKRREENRYLLEMLNRLVRKKRPDLIVKYCSAVLVRRPGPKFRRQLNIARKTLEQS